MDTRRPPQAPAAQASCRALGVGCLARTTRPSPPAARGRSHDRKQQPAVLSVAKTASLYLCIILGGGTVLAHCNERVMSHNMCVSDETLALDGEPRPCNFTRRLHLPRKNVVRCSRDAVHLINKTWLLYRSVEIKYLDDRPEWQLQLVGRSFICNGSFHANSLGLTALIGGGGRTGISTCEHHHISMVAC